MNKVFNINLGGAPLTIDDDAYKFLENYLQSLHNHFRQSEGYEEIMNDIEARLGELLREGMGKRAIATIQDVKNAVSVMGTPEDFGAESIDNQQDTQKKSTHTEGPTTGGIKTGKRLFRDEDDKMISGVCSGIAAYFGLESATWVRIAFAIMFFLFGTGGGLYIILMMIIPKASTTADRLAMRGEPIDVNSIAKAVEEGVEKISQKVNDFGKPENQEKFNSQVKHFSSHVSNTVGYILRGMGGAFKWIAGIISIILVASILIAWVSAAIGIGWAYPIFDYMTDSNILPKLAIFNGFWIIAVPTAAIILFIRRIFFKGRTNVGIQIGMWTFFAVNFFCLASIIGRFSREFNQEIRTSQNIELGNANNEVLNISKLETAYSEPTTKLGRLKISDEYLLSKNVSIYIEKSKTDQFELIKTIQSSGRNSTEANALAQSVDYRLESKGNSLQLSNSFIIPKGTKWRDQTVQLTLKIPVGKRLKIDKDVYWGHFYSINFDEVDEQHYCWDNDVAYWEMTEKGLKCLLPKPKEEDEN
jgi:phage shock protein PspC (stress-responsive transcriptional regulator)